MRVYAQLFDEKMITPVGYLMAKEVQSYTLADNAHEYVDMPTDHPWRKLLVRAQRDGAEFTAQLAHMKLSQEADKKVIFDHDSRDVVLQQMSQSPPYREHLYGSGYAVAKNHWCTPALYVRFGRTSWRTTVAGGDGAMYSGAGGRFQHIQAAAGPNWQAICEGFLPHAVMEYPFGLQDEINDWFNVSGLGSVKLDITGGAAVGTANCEVCLQQFVQY